MYQDKSFIPIIPDKWWDSPENQIRLAEGTLHVQDADQRDNPGRGGTARLEYQQL